MPIYSYNRYVSTGTQPFSITFDYLSKDHIEVYLDNVLQTSGYTIDTSTNQLTFTSVPGSGVVVLIKRVTPKSKTDFQSQIADFQDGSVLTESDLDTAALGLLYISQEAEDSASADGLALDQLDEQWDGQNKRIKRLTAPTSDTDAATKAYVDGLSLYPGVPSVPQKWVLSGNGSTTTFTLDSTSGSGDPAATDVNTFIVDVDGVLQKPTTDFTLSSTSITFTSAPASGTNNVTVRNFGVAKDIMAQPIRPSSVSDVGLTVKGLPSQSANILDVQNSSGTSLFGVDPSGILKLAGNTGMTIRQIVSASYDTSANATDKPYIRWTGSSSYKAPGISITITPQSTSSKILFFSNIRTRCSNEYQSTGINMGFYKTTSGLLDAGDTQSGGSWPPAGYHQVFIGALVEQVAGPSGDEGLELFSIYNSLSWSWMDEPNTTSPVYYNLMARLKHTTGTQLDNPPFIEVFNDLTTDAGEAVTDPGYHYSTVYAVEII